MTIPRTLRILLGAGLLCGAGLAVRADDTVTFQVDMSSYTNGAGQQAATLVEVRGGNIGPGSWGSGNTLVNNGENVYTNIFTVAGTTGDKLQYKFAFTTPAGVTWEDNNPPPGAGQPPDEGNNRVLVLVGGAQTLPVVPFYAPSVTLPIELPSNLITYRVDMTAQIQLGNFIPSTGVDTIRVTGNPAALTGWGAGVDLTNNATLSGDASNIYSAVIDIRGMPGVAGGAYKFRMNGGWEDTFSGYDRDFTINGGDQVLPVVYYSDHTPGAATNGTVTFRVDVTPQVLTGGFTNGVTEMGISGAINNWGKTPMTNDMSLSGNAKNIYSITLPLDFGLVSDYSKFKFRLNDDWESAAVYGVGKNNDRVFYITGGDQVLPVVTYRDASVCDLLQQETTVTVVLQLTNGTPDKNGVLFDKVNDQVYLNGEFISWNASGGYWTAALPVMTNNPVGSDYYEQTIVLPTGSARHQEFKFGISGTGHGGLDNEGANGANHVAYIRSSGSTYTLPVAQFGPTFASTLVEQQWGNLTVGAPSGGNVPITWLGLPCVTLQTRTSLTTGSWADLPATDATSSTNWPNTGGVQLFRLQKRSQP